MQRMVLAGCFIEFRRGLATFAGIGNLLDRLCDGGEIGDRLPPIGRPGAFRGGR